MKTLQRIVFLIAVCLAFEASAMAQKIKIKPEQIPADFKEYTDTLLIVDFPVIMGYRKFLRRNFSKYYSGPFRYVTRAEYLSSKTRHYRFVFQAQEEFDRPTFSFSDSKQISYTLFDNQKHTHYKTMGSRYYSELMIAYIKKLDEELKKNQVASK